MPITLARKPKPAPKDIRKPKKPRGDEIHNQYQADGKDFQKPYRVLVESAMTRQDHSIADTARGAKISRLSLSRWLGGERNINVEQFARVLEYLGLSITSYSSKAKR
jgi:transcriptional regulator with XRE-family HTH domain